MSTHETAFTNYRTKTATNRMGLWLFIISDAFVFGGLLVTRAFLWGGNRPHLDQGLGLAVTGILLLSSFFMNRAETAMAHGDRRTFVRGILTTLALAILFLGGVIGIEWRTAPFSASENQYGAVFFMLTGMHAFHVLTGVIFLLIVWRNEAKGLYTAERHWPVEAAAVYWHFIDVVWIFLYPAIYLIGTVI
jgi:cytochrome c oxidase subunit 3